MKNHAVRATCALLAVALAAVGCGSGGKEAGRTPTVEGSAADFSIAELEVFGDHMVLQIDESGPPRPGAPENPVLLVRASGETSVWDPVDGRVTGRIRRGEVVELLAEARGYAEPLIGDHVGDEELHCFGFTIGWLSPTGAHRAHYECGEFDQFDDIEAWADTVRAELASRFATRVAQPDTPVGTTNRLWIGPEMETCTTTLRQMCLMAATSPTGEFEPLGQDVEGFVHVPGTSYVIDVLVKPVEGSLLADAPSKTLVLREVLEEHRSLHELASASLHPDELELLGNAAVLSHTVGTWAPEDAERNPVLEVRASGQVTLWDDDARDHVMGVIDRALVAQLLQRVHRAADGYQGIYDDPEGVDCGVTNYRWLQEDLEMGSISVSCATFEGEGTVGAAYGDAREHLVGVLAESAGAEVGRSIDVSSAPHQAGLEDYVRDADEVYQRDAAVDQRVAQLSANCASGDRLSLIAGNIASRPAAVPDFLVQHLFICADLVTSLGLDVGPDFVPDLDGLRSLAMSTNPRVLEDEGLFERFVTRLGEDCTSPDLLVRMLDTYPEPDTWLLGWHAFICPDVVTGLNA